MYEYTANLDRVVDGDTMDVTIDMGFKITTNQRIRFAYINAPEIFKTPTNSPEYKLGMKAKRYIEKRLRQNGNEMRLVTYKWAGMHGRYTGIVWLEDSKISLNEELVKKGLAESIKKIKAIDVRKSSDEITPL